jgi:HEAT repeat protein
MKLFHLNEADVEQLKNKEDIKGLIKALKYKDDRSVRYRAAEALGEIENNTAVEALISVLNDEYLPTKEMAIIALGEIGDKRAVLPLISNFNDANDELRDMMIFSLGEIGGRESLEYLKLALEDENYDIKLRAVEAWEKYLILNP